MRSLIYSSTLIGVEAHLVAVEVVVTNGLPGLTVVGLPDAAVSEAGARVRSALKLSGFTLPPRRMVVNLAPADLRKTGSGFDLALALGLLQSLGEIPETCLQDTLVVGELSLSGEIRPVRGVVSSVALATQDPHIRKIIIPACQAGSLPDWQGAEVVGVGSLEQVVSYCKGEAVSTVGPTEDNSFLDQRPRGTDLAQVRGQGLGKLAMEIAAAGGHHLAMVGPPGCGKSYLAGCLPSLLPPLTEEEQREVAVISSVCREESFSLARPFRAPGNAITPVALLGGYEPGEVTRAHRGVLFLDEFPEFRRDTLESLRLVLEEGRVKVSRARMKVVYPADFTLICAMNPCPCGFHGVTGEMCTCGAGAVARYRSKLSGPLMDRFDLLVGLNRVPIQQQLGSVDSPTCEDSATVACRVLKARERQWERGQMNRTLRGETLFQALAWTDGDRIFAHALADEERMSMRAFEKWLRVARTLADLQGERKTSRHHLMAARSVRFATTDCLAA